MDPHAQAEAIYWEFANFTVRTYGPLVWAGSLMTGLVVVQCFNYLKRHPTDPPLLRLLAVWITSLQVASAILECLGHAVQDKMMADRLIGPGIFAPFSDAWLILIMTFTSLTAQAFYAKLVYRMLRGFPNQMWARIWASAFCVIWLAVAAAGITTCAEFTLIPTKYWIPDMLFIDISGLPVKSYIVWVTIAASLDATLSTLLMSQFIRGIRRDGFAQTNSMLSSLARATLETFLLTSTIAIADLACIIFIMVGSPTTQAHMQLAGYGFTVLLARAYCTSFLYTISHHASIRKSRNEPSSGGIHKSAGNLVGTGTAKGIRSPPSSGHRLARGHFDGPASQSNEHGIELTSSAVTLSRDEDTRRAVEGGYSRDGAGVRVDTEKNQTFENAEPGDHYVVPIMGMDHHVGDV